MRERGDDHGPRPGRERAIETEDCMIMSRLKRATMMGLSIRMTAGDDQ